jgi:uncharacterized membrane protein
MITFFVTYFAIPVANASGHGLLDKTEEFELTELINKAIAYAIMVAALLSIVFIFVGGISFILSGGAEEKIKQAVSTIRYAIIGLIVSILSVLIVQTLGKFIGLDVVKYVNFNEIIGLIEEISSDIKGEGGSSGPNSLD